MCRPKATIAIPHDRRALVNHPTAANSVSAGARVYVFGSLQRVCELSGVLNSVGADYIRELSGQTAVIDGTGVSCCTSNPPSSGNETQGLINIVNQSYLVLAGFEIRNFTTSNAAYTPGRRLDHGSGTGIQLLNNLVHNITTSSEENGNAFASPFTDLADSDQFIWSSLATRSTA